MRKIKRQEQEHTREALGYPRAGIVTYQQRNGEHMKPSNTPEFSEAQYEYLSKVFPRLDITPSSTHAECLYSAGQQSVLSVIKQRVKVWNKVRIGPEVQ